MALLGNYTVLNKSTGRHLGGLAQANARSNFNTSGANRNLWSNSTVQKRSSVPDGYRPGSAWRIAVSSGGLGAFTTMASSGTITNANLAAGVNLSASLTGSGTVTSAVGSLIVSAVATLTGSGTISSADMVGVLNAAATLTGSGDITSAALGAMAGMSATLTGAGTVTADINAIGSMSATIVSTGDVLNSANVASLVWNAVAADFNASGTMGRKLNDAADPWVTVLETGFTASLMLRIIAAAAAGRSSGGPGSPVFRNLANTQDQITGTANSSGDRSAVTYGS
jgi:hypothetical protein